MYISKEALRPFSLSTLDLLVLFTRAVEEYNYNNVLFLTEFISQADGAGIKNLDCL